MPEILGVQEVLTPHSLTSPDLEVLRPTEGRYTCLVLQPEGPIAATSSRIGNLHKDQAATKGRKFLELALSRGAHLAITPEYFLPWSALEKALNEDVSPPDSSLWILGCESITPAELLAFKQSIAHKCLVEFEPLALLPAHGVVLDPVVLLFHAKTAQNGSQLVALVQFKTTPSRDNVFLEEGLLKRGSKIYRFFGASGHLSLATLICSDVFGLSDALVSTLIDRSTLVHVQLNPDPRNSQYRAYRTRTFATDPKASDCHLLCLNWARSIVQHGETKVEEWKNIGGSAWYCSSDGCSKDDPITYPNHQNGLYYTWLRKERRHALLFNYDQAVFEMQVPKLLTVGPAVLANRNGPSVVQRFTWSFQDQAWKPGVHPVDSGWNSLLNEYDETRAALSNVVAAHDSLGVERALALTAGSINGMDGWHIVTEIDSCCMESEEIVFRLTFAQDVCEKAADFRHARLMRVADLADAISKGPVWPPQVVGMNANAHLSWDSGNPNFNMRTDDGRPTLVVHLGESPTPNRLTDVPEMLAGLLNRGGGAHRKRLCVLYRKFGDLRFAPIPALTRFDQDPGDPSEFTSAQPREGFQ